METNGKMQPMPVDIQNSSLELLEQHQAREQARLLQRFRELREWQQQQQQQLMQQQQHQLRTWQDEQSKVQTLIASQGGKTIKMSNGSSRSPLMTPPTKPRPGQTANLMADSVSQSQVAGLSLDSGLVVSMQDTLKSQSSLPKPVMYPSLTSTVAKDNEDDKYTDSELFSNLGSHEELQERAQEVEEDGKPCPDWMSDSSENFLKGSQLPPPRLIRGGNQLAGLEQLLKTAPAGLLQQMLGLLPGSRGVEAQMRGGRGSEDVELSASPTLPTSGNPKQPTARRLLDYHGPSEDEDNSPELSNGVSPVAGTQQMSQSRQLSQQQQREQQMILLMQQQQEQLNYVEERQQQQRSYKQMPGSQQQHSKSGLVLGPLLSESDLDSNFIPRAVSLNDSDTLQPKWLNGYHRQTDREEENDSNIYQNGVGEDDVSEEDEDGDSEDENEAQNSMSKGNEDRPITGTGGKKTFEELLEEQLQQERAKQKQQTDNGGAQHKIPFLKKGEGIARFNSAPQKPPLKKKQTSKAQGRPQQMSGSSGGESVRGRNTEDVGRKATVGSRLKNMGKPADSSETSFGEKKGFVRKLQPNQNAQEEKRPVAKLSLIRSVANKKLEEQQKQMQQQEQDQQQQQQQEQQQRLLQKQSAQHLQPQRVQDGDEEPFFGTAPPRRLGDLSTIIEQSPSLDGRSMITDDHDSTELDSLAEFEALEEAADNMSLCSSSSLVARLVYGDKQGQKEAVKKLKTITESLKSARSDGSGSGLEETKVDTGSEVVRMNNNNNCYSQSDSGEPSVAIAKSKDRRNDINAEKQSQESSDVTLTDSSDDENVELQLVGSHMQTAKFGRSSGDSAGETNPGNSASTVSQAASPSKVLTRKVAPLSSKFSAATDTLSLLKSLSAQANLLTSDPPHSSPPTTSGQTSSVSSAAPAAADEGPVSNFAASERLDFFSEISTLPPNFFSTAAKDGMLLASTFGPSLAETFQTSSSSVMSTVPSFPFSGNNAISQIPKTSSNESQSHRLNGASTGNQNKTGKESYSDNSDDDESKESDSSDNESVGHEKGSDNDEGNAGKTKNLVDRWQKNEMQEGERKKEEAKENSHGVGFDDESAWEDEDDDEAFDSATTLKTKSTSASQPKGEPATPPTSRLVCKLFPKLRPKPNVENEKKQQSLQEAAGQPVNATMGVQSSILREKLKELDAEIEKFRSENSNLEKLRREREEGLSKLKQEIENFQREKESELKRLEEFKAEEMKKLKRERKLFDSYQKKVRSMPDKKEREEIENLKIQLQEVQEELKRKESRWTASTARLKNRVAELELENGEVKEEVRILERKRLEWMTSQGVAGRSGAHASNGKIGGPSSIGGASAAQMSGQAGPRSSTPTGESGQQISSVQHKGGTRQGGSSLPTKTASAPNNNSNGSNNYSNNNTRSKGNKPTASHHNVNMNNNNSNNNNSHKSMGPGGGGGTKAVSNDVAPGTAPPTSASSQHAYNPPSSTASLVAPTIPVIVLATPSQQHPQHQQLQQQNVRLWREGGEGPQTMQNPAVPVMMECTIPAATEVSKMPGLQSDLPAPDKSAARQATERAVVDKGDPSVFTESRHQDGKLEKSFRTGAKEILFPNGTVKEISADGQTIVCRLANGDIRQIFPDHRVVYIFSEAQIMQTTFPDGLETFQFQNGQVERRYPDGTVEITFPSKDIKYLFPDGGQEVILTDGTVMQYNSQGERTVEYPSGDREVHTAEYQRREFPDGIIKTIYADGRHETRFPNGRVRMRDKDGNVVMDQIVYR